MSNAIRVANVRVDEVLFHPHNIRRDLGDLRQLADSIRRFGVMQPIVVERNGVNLRLRAGHRRLAAARIAGLTRIPAVIHPEALPLDEWLMSSIQENVMRRSLDDTERRRACEALLKLDCTRAGIAEVFGVSVATIGNWLRPADDEPGIHHDSDRPTIRPPTEPGRSGQHPYAAARLVRPCLAGGSVLPRGHG